MKHLLHYIRNYFSREARWCWYSKFCNTITCHTKQGIFTVSTKDNSVGKDLFCRGEYELSTITKVFRTLDQEKLLSHNGEGILLDVGANCGIISIGILTQQHLKRAIAIEPEPLNFFLLTKNVRSNNLRERITPLQFAVSQENGRLTFELSKDNLGDHRIRTSGAKHSLPDAFGESVRSTIEVQSRKLDDLLAELPEHLTSKICLVWMDIQGFEGFAIRGAQALFKTSIPLMSELWPYGIIRSGLSKNEYCSIVGSHWKHVWVCSGDLYVKHPITFVDQLWVNLGETGEYDNVIYTA